MNRKTKGLIIGVCTFALAVGMVGCTTDNKETKENKEKAQVEKKAEDKKEVVVEANKKGYSKELAKFFPQVEGSVFNYYGTAEYGQTMTLNKVTKSDDTLTLLFKGEMVDQSDGEGPSREERLIDSIYTISDKSVVEKYTNTRKYPQSIISEVTALQLPLEKANSWEDKVTIEGKDMVAKTVIVEVNKDDKERLQVRTKTTIEGLKGYPEDTYTEERVFKEGLGLASYSSNILLGEGDDITPFEFGYMLFEKE